VAITINAGKRGHHVWWEGLMHGLVGASFSTRQGRRGGSPSAAAHCTTALVSVQSLKHGWWVFLQLGGHCICLQINSGTNADRVRGPYNA
jgi:hypothetical protein